MIESGLDDILQPPHDDAQRLKFNRILDAANRLFERHGYRKTNIGDIAKEAGIAKGTVYLYFKSKADLLVHTIVQEKKNYLEEMAAIFDESLSPIASLKSYIRTSITLSRKMPLTSRLLKGDHEIALVLSELDSDLLDPDNQMEVSLVADMVDAAAAPHNWSAEELQARTVVLINLIFAGIFGDQLFRMHTDVEHLADLISDTLVDGIAHRR